MSSVSSTGLVQIPCPSTAKVGSVWFRIAPDSRCFDGHFIDAPVFPGVAHITLVLSALAHFPFSRRALSGLRDVRFSRPLFPGDEVEVVLRDGSDASSVRFEVRCRDERASCGLLVFAHRND